MPGIKEYKKKSTHYSSTDTYSGLRGLEGLRGLGEISEEERQQFMLDNEDALRNYRKSSTRNKAAEIMYNNQKFKDTFGEDTFNQLNDGSAQSYQYRNNLLKEKVVGDAFTATFSPYVGKNRVSGRGLGDDWEKYNELSTSAKEKLLRSDYLTPSEFEKQNDKSLGWIQTVGDVGSWIESIGMGMGLSKVIPGLQDIVEKVSPSKNVTDFVKEGISEYKRRQNQNILESIYNDDIDDKAKQLGGVVQRNYQDILSLSDEQVKQAFYQAITPNSYTTERGLPNLGIAEYAARYGDGSQVSSEMEDFSIDDMRQVLAKKKTYEIYMSPMMASTALNNEAKRYLHDRQGSLKRFGLWAKDTGISALSYSADKVNGLYNLGLLAYDQMADWGMGQKAHVMMDDQGNVVDTTKVTIVKDGRGNMRYEGADGKVHAVHEVEMNWTDLHNLGKKEDGSDDSSILNPQYWTKAEQFGTLDEAEQHQYSQLGTSPYKVAYNPNEESDLWYESFKMMSFGLADGVSMLIPYGIGAAGKFLSTASKVGKVGNALGKAVQFAGTTLSNETKAGQLAQGVAGAAGIAYAYQRGAFQETLAQNLAEAEQTLLNDSREQVMHQYENDAQYREQLDMAIHQRAGEMKQEILSQALAQYIPVDETAVNEMVIDRAENEILGQQIDQLYQQRKGSQEYADLQQQAIRSAGSAANTTFLPEAIKYGIVNTVGFRKFIYSNPTSVAKKISNSFKGLVEKTTEEGTTRLATEGSKFTTRAQKLKQMGKVLGNQVWGGAWTNGTDDMMVDAAERINVDSYNRYLNDYVTGESTADLYGFTDGWYSYLKGLGNSLGQETTWNAAAVGGFGSVLSLTPNMVNIASLATRQGREAYRNNFLQRKVYDTDTEGYRKPQLDEQGNPIFQKTSWGENWRDRFAFFIQNGILQEYYGKKQEERNLQEHADYVNAILDHYKDFENLQHLITSDIALQNASNFGDEKTGRFVKAIETMAALNQLGENENDPTTLSSVVQDAKRLIARASQMNEENQEDAFTEEELANLIGQYYAAHPDLAQTEENNQRALQDIQTNAQELIEAAEAFDEAEQQIQTVENGLGYRVDDAVRHLMKVNQALDKHWRKRADKMQDEIGDGASMQGEVSTEDVIATVGGKKNAEALIRVYNTQEKDIAGELEKQHQEVVQLQQKYKEAQQAREAAQSSQTRLQAQEVLDAAAIALQEAQMGENYLQSLIDKTQGKKSQIEEALQLQGDEADKVLTAQEIFGLDVRTRAKMMAKQNRELYSKAQQAEIEKLEGQLLMKDGDALNKIQDLSLLSYRIAANEDAYSRMAQNPRAAVLQVEKQRERAARTAYQLIDRRNAETIVEVIHQMDEGLNGYEEVTQDFKDEFVYKTLRNKNSRILSIIDKENLLPKYQQQLNEAKEWSKVISDLATVIESIDESEQWKSNIEMALNGVVESSRTKDEILDKLEKIIDDVDNPQIAADVERIMSGLEQMSYQRDATVLENRKQRKQREEQKRQQQVAEKKAVEDAQVAAAQAQAAEEAKRQAEEAKPQQEVLPDGSNLIIPDEEVVDQNPETAEQQGELSAPVVWNVAHSLMDAEAEDGSIEMGSIWEGSQDNAQKVLLSVEKKDGKIRVLAGTTPISFTLDASDWVLPQTDAEALDQQGAQELGITKNTPVTVDFLEKIGDKWYFSGIFEGQTDKTPHYLVMSDAFNLDTTIEKERQGREARLLSQGIDTANAYITDEGDAVSVHSMSLEDQLKEALETGATDVQTTQITTDIDVLNQAGQIGETGSVTTLSGTAMSEWEQDALENVGILKHKQGAEVGDKMNQYYDWMAAEGIHLQDIIDEELGVILKMNPHAPVKFMAVRPQDNATHDVRMKTHLMLVLDYDNRINKGITQIHQDKNGGVIESNGKKYLVVGVVGYGKSKEGQALYDILFSNNGQHFGLVKKGSGQFWAEHPSDRFYVPEHLSTEVVPSYPIPGWRVKQMETDTATSWRDVFDLLKDPQRNPLHIQHPAWLIQEVTQPLVIGTDVQQVMVPQDSGRNSGNTFVLIPASNGKYMPAYIKPLFYTEMRDSVLKDRVMQYLHQLQSPVYAERLQAAIALGDIFYLQKDGDWFLLRKDRAEISLVHNGVTFRTFVIGEGFNPQEFMEAMETMNPRINITARGLRNPEMLKQYNDIGALQTDIAKFGTAGASYRIYGLDAEGNMLKAEEPENLVPQVSNATDTFRKNNYRQVIWNHQYYQYDATENQYYLNSVPITDAGLIEELDYNREIVERDLVPVLTQGVWKYYVLEEGEHPQAVKVHQNTKHVVKATEAQAAALIEGQKKRGVAEKREQAAQDALQSVVSLSDVNLPLGTEIGESMMEVPTETQVEEKEKKDEKEVKTSAQSQVQVNEISPVEAENVGGTQTFAQLAVSKNYRIKVLRFLQNLWKERYQQELPTDLEAVTQLLKEKGVNVESISKTEVGVEAWMRDVECRI